MSLISILLFMFGAGLFYLGRIRFGELNEEGNHVRAAGLVLMAPLVGIFMLGIIMGAMTGADPERVRGALAFLSLLEFLSWGAALYGAYYLLYQKGDVKLPFNLPFDANGEAGKASAAEKADKPEKPIINFAPPRQSYPPVMNLSQAARYLRVSEREVMKAIEDGQIAASKGTNGYAIARVVLDDYLADKSNKSRDEAES